MLVCTQQLSRFLFESIKTRYMKVEHVSIKNTEYGRRLDCLLDGREATFWSPATQLIILCGAACMFKTTMGIFDAGKILELLRPEQVPRTQRKAQQC